MSWEVDIQPRLDETADDLARWLIEKEKGHSVSDAQLIAYKNAVNGISHELTTDGERTLRRLLHAPAAKGLGIRDWWTGRRVETAWDAIHDGERVLLHDSSDEADLGAAAILLQQRVEQLPPANPLRRDAETWLKDEVVGWLVDPDRSPPSGPRLEALHAAAYAAHDEWHRTLRYLRNVLAGTALALTAAWLIVGCVKALWPAALPVCGTDAGCLSGDGGWDLLQISLVGALGGLVGAAIPLTRLTAVASRYNVRTAQIALKPALGGATAVMGVLLLTSGLVDGVDQSPQAVLAYAALFGMSQQLLTTFVDRRIGDLLGVKKDAEERAEPA